MSASTEPIQVLVDADNVFPARLQPVLDVLAQLTRPVRVVAAGNPRALARVRWPEPTDSLSVSLIEAAGWQSADLVLATAYVPGPEPLLLITGDGDFALLAGRHAGPVLVVSGSPSGRFRDVASLLDPALEGLAPLERWLGAV